MIIAATSQDTPHPEPPDDPRPSHREGTIYGLKAVAAEGFSYQTTLATGERMRFELGPSPGLDGEIQLKNETVHLDLKTPSHVTGNSVSFPLEAGLLNVIGPLALERYDIDLAIPIGGTPRGRVVGPRTRGGQLRIEVPGLSGPVVASHVELDDMGITLEDGRTRLIAGRLTIGRLLVPVGDKKIRLDQLVVTGLKIESEIGGAPLVTAATARAETAQVRLETGHLTLHDLTLHDIERDRAGGVAIGQARCDRAQLSTRRSSRPKHGGRGKRKSPIALTFLDGLEGHIHADVSTHVKLPIIPDWNALHRVRLDVVEGRVQYDRLEHGMSKLPDAVLDFNLRESKLCLDKDIPLVPFDRTTLLSWDLPAGERRHAEEGWIRLSRLFEPKVEIERHEKERDEGSRYLQEVRIHDIDVSLQLAPEAVITLPQGGALRLGGAVKMPTDDSPAIEETSMRGEIVYRPDHRRPRGGVTIEADGLTLGVEGLPVGERLLEITRIVVDELRSEVKTRDLSVDRVILDADNVQLDQVALSAGG